MAILYIFSIVKFTFCYFLKSFRLLSLFCCVSSTVSIMTVGLVSAIPPSDIAVIGMVILQVIILGQL